MRNKIFVHRWFEAILEMSWERERTHDGRLARWRCRLRDGGRGSLEVTLLPLWDRVIGTLAISGLVRARARLIDASPNRARQSGDRRLLWSCDSQPRVINSGNTQPQRIAGVTQ